MVETGDRTDVCAFAVIIERIVGEIEHLEIHKEWA
jgi:hypothetical protein